MPHRSVLNPRRCSRAPPPAGRFGGGGRTRATPITQSYYRRPALPGTHGPSILPTTTTMSVPSRSYVCRPPQLSGLLAWCPPSSAKTAAAQVPTASRAHAPSACGRAVNVCFQAERTMTAPADAPFLTRIRRGIFRRRPRELPVLMRIPPRTLYFHGLTVCPRGRWSPQPNRGGQGCGT